MIGSYELDEQRHRQRQAIIVAGSILAGTAALALMKKGKLRFLGPVIAAGVGAAVNHWPQIVAAIEKSKGHHQLAKGSSDDYRGPNRQSSSFEDTISDDRSNYDTTDNPNANPYSPTSTGDTI